MRDVHDRPMVGLSIRGVVACGDHATMQAHHRYMQELVSQHTVSLVDAALDSIMWGGDRSRDVGPSVSAVTQTQSKSEKCAGLGKESISD